MGIALQGFTLTAVGLNGALPNAFDGNTGGATGITTAGNELHQVFEFAFNGAATPTLDLNVPANSVYYPIDTHFLVEPPPIALGQGPSENQVVADATEAPFAGYGSFLTGVFTLTTPLVDLTPTWDFAYIVAQAGTQVNLDFRIADGSGQHPFEQVQTSFVIPEPSTVSLLVIGAAGVALALRARRRRG